MSLSRIEELLEMINNKSGPTDMIPLSRTEEILKCYINGTAYTGPITSRFEELLYNTLYKQPSDEQPLSRSEEILKSKIDKTTYEGAILSRVEELLLELKTEPDPVEITIGPDTILHVLNAIEAAAVSLKIDLTPTQDGTPWISDTLNTEPYLLRAAQNGNTADETIVGGTVCFNQMIQNGDFSDGTNHWNPGSSNVTISASDNILTVNKPLSTTNGANQKGDKLADHVYLCTAEAKKVSGDDFQIRYMNNNSTSLYTLIDSETWMEANQIVKSGASTTNINLIYIRYESPNTGIANVRNVRVMDLTQMFGSTIADYVYSLETANKGAGVAWLHSHGFIDDIYHAYNTGTLVSAKPTAKVVGDTTYTLGGADLRGLFKLDANNNLYCDGDVYTSDGTITRNFEYRAYQSGDESLTDAITDGTNTVVKLTTATTETSTAYTNPQKAGEAEAFVDARTEKVPVGHSTRYSAEYDINGFEGVTVHVSETQTGGTTYPVTFTSQGTVYGGTVDVVSGEMSITYAIEDLGNLSWITVTFTSLGIVFMAYLQADDTGTSYVTAYAKANLPAFSYGEYSLESDNLFIRDPRTTDGNEFKRLVTGQKIVYKLAEPITATIDPTEISLNEGENYVWTEEGTTTLTYMAKAAQRVLAMNRTLQKNLKSIELKKGGDVK